MLLFLEIVNIIAILLMLFMLAVVLKQQPSKVQTAFILYDVFTIIFVVGIHLELLHSDTIGEALSGLCVQYVGQAGLLLALLWFVSEFAKFYIPLWVYGLEAICDTFVLIGVFTAQKHHFFYTSMEILTDGMYNRIKVGHGILWYLHFIILDAVVFTILILCMMKYKKSTPMHKKRIRYIIVGFSVLETLLLLKRIGVFGSYNPIVIAMTFNMFCMMIAMIRYSYFDSLHAAIDNAFNHGNEGLVILDKENTIVFVNHRMNTLFPDIHKGSIIDCYPEITKLMNEGEHLLHTDGTVYELRVEDIIEHNEKNGCMLWFVDQTQSLLTIQKFKEADEAKTQFLMKVSHELRTPMNTMLGINEMIVRESGEEEIKNYAKEVAAAGGHMMSLIDEILNASRLENGTITSIKTPYQISEVIGRVEELMRPQIEKKGLVFTVEIEECLTSENKYQMGDEAHIFQVLVNLLSNAMKYTDNGFVCLKAKIQKTLKDKKLLLSISDSGIGIQKDELTKIFDNFERGSNTSGRDGIGLGLAIVKQLVDAMGGTLAVESVLGEGSVFTVSLIWIDATEEDFAIWKKKEQKKEEFITDEQEKNLLDFHTKTILIVDDNNNNLKVLKYLLKRTKVAVETALDGGAAVQACIHKKYDLILLDHMMPGMDGIAAFHQIKEGENGKNRDTTIVALTANVGKGVEQMYLSEGFADYLTKPVEPQKLEQVLFRYLSLEKENDKAKEGIENAGKNFLTEDEWLTQLEQNGIHTQEGLRYADMDISLYKELLILFAKQKEKQQQKLNEICQNIIKQENTLIIESEKEKYENPESSALWNMWIVSCHGLKGEARGIGASILGEYFYQMEMAGRTQDKEKIEQIYVLAVKEWNKVVNGIQLTIKELLLS